MLLNLEYALKCDAFIGTLESNSCRLVDEMRTTIGTYVHVYVYSLYMFMYVYMYVYVYVCECVWETLRMINVYAYEYVHSWNTSYLYFIHSSLPLLCEVYQF
jgi:hypothetical protein